jgi:pimeloyl-ACP methyl ester carboxylesterase
LIKSIFGSYLNGDSLRNDEQSLRLARSTRLPDLKFVLDQLQLLRVPGAWFASKLDLSRIAVMGHSLGAEVALSSLQHDPRLRAAVLLDAPITDEDIVGTNKPVLLLAAGRERWSNEECSLWNSLRGPRLAVNLLHAEHFTPSDALWLFKDVPGLIATGKLGVDGTIAMLRALIVGFFDTHLRSRPGRFHSDFAISESAGALLTMQNQSLCR